MCYIENCIIMRHIIMRLNCSTSFCLVRLFESSQKTTLYQYYCFLFCRQDWYTSAEKDTKDRDPRYVWTSTSVVLQLYSQFWVTPQTPFNLDKTMNLVTYSYNFGEFYFINSFLKYDISCSFFSKKCETIHLWEMRNSTFDVQRHISSLFN